MGKQIPRCVPRPPNCGGEEKARDSVRDDKQDTHSANGSADKAITIRLKRRARVVRYRGEWTGASWWGVVLIFGEFFARFFERPCPGGGMAYAEDLKTFVFVLVCKGFMPLL